MAAPKLLSLQGLRDRGITTSNCRLRRLEALSLFPRRVRPTPRTVAWIADEIDAHLARKVAERDCVAA